MKRCRVGMLLALVIAVMVSACSGDADSGPTITVTPRDDFRIGLVTGGALRDGTFNEAAHRGAQRAAQDFGLDYDYRESMEETDAEFSLHLESLLADGRNIIITVSFNMADLTRRLAEQHPDVFFIGLDQFHEDPPPNLVGLLFEEDEGGFLAGALAGMMTETGVVGVVGGEEIPPVVRFVDGFVNGVHYVNPAAEALTTYAPAPGGFSNADFGRSTARTWVQDQQVDVLFGAAGLTGSFAITEASRLGAWVIGVDQDEYRSTFAGGVLGGAERLLTSALKRVDRGVYDLIAQVIDGTFEGRVRTIGAAACGISLAPFHEAENSIPQDVQVRLEAIWRALAGGTLTTGASGAEDDAPPESLAAGALPDVDVDAPSLADCEL